MPSTPAKRTSTTSSGAELNFNYSTSVKNTVTNPGPNNIGIGLVNVKSTASVPSMMPGQSKRGTERRAANIDTFQRTAGVLSTPKQDTVLMPGGCGDKFARTCEQGTCIPTMGPPAGGLLNQQSEVPAILRYIYKATMNFQRTSTLSGRRSPLRYKDRILRQWRCLEKLSPANSRTR